MKQLNETEFEQLLQAFDSLCNMYYASDKNNFSKCGSFHIKPFNTHWDKRTVKEVMYNVKLYLGTWVIYPIEEAMKLNRTNIKRQRQKSNTRQQSAREYADKACDTTPRKNDGYPLTRTLGELKDDAIQDFLAGCEYADGGHREFYKLVMELMSDYVNTPFIDDEETMKMYRLTEQIRKHLASFTEREQPKDTE